MSQSLDEGHKVSAGGVMFKYFQTVDDKEQNGRLSRFNQVEQ